MLFSRAHPAPAPSVEPPSRPRSAERRRDLLTLVAGVLVFGTTIAVFSPRTVAEGAAPARLRLAHFPSLLHAPALVGLAKGAFAEALADRARIEVRVVEAGPRAMEALLAGEVDVAWVGPGPAINAWVRSRGAGLRVVSGACAGGASLVFRGDVAGRSVPDLAGRRVAVPQLGNTQDISLRRFLGRAGLASRAEGGAVAVLPVPPPDVLTLFHRKELDAAWVPEPWATRLVLDGGARRVADERDLWPCGTFPSAIVVARTAFLEAHPDLVEALRQAHAGTIAWIRAHPGDAKRVVNEELRRLTGKALSEAVITEAWGRVSFTDDPDPEGLRASVEAAVEAGYLRGPIPSLEGLIAARSGAPRSGR